ncbi:MAG: acyltransferase family protein [Clostridia bacterium]|nr:acyltransferase family protein [Clostridia bacterium]
MENTINSNELEIEKEPRVVNEENKKSNENKNYNAIDLTKFIMAIFVVAIHTKPILSFVDVNSFFYNIFIKLTDYAVPFFFLCSFYFLLKKMKRVGEGNISSIDSLIILKNYIKKMFRLYCVWKILYLPFDIYRIFTNDAGILKNVLYYLRDFVFRGGWSGGHLWYILATIYMSIFLYVFLRLKAKNSLIVVLSFIIFIFGICFGYLISIQDNLPSILNKLTVFFVNIFLMSRIFVSFIYLALIIMVIDLKISFKWFYLLLATVILCVVKIVFRNFFINSFISPIAHFSFFLFILSIKISSKINYVYLRKQSTIIYFIHMLFVYFCSLFFANGIGWQSFIISSILSIGVASIILLIQKKKDFKIFKWLF